METKSLTAVEVCAILDSCKKNGVRTLCFGGLAVELGADSPSPLEEYPQLSPPQAEAARKVEEKALQSQELDHKEDRIASLIIEDPLAYEERIAQGDLTDGKHVEREDGQLEPESEGQHEAL